jgi:hypothetical protein
LPVLPADRTEYILSDVSAGFLAPARDKFAQYAFVDYRVLDIESDPIAQGFAGHAYDLVLAANVLHATTDLRQTLAHVQRLLAPSGLLVLLEATRRLRWVDVTFGALEGWRKFTDTDLRPAHPLLTAAQWRPLLASAAFTDAVSVPADDGAGQAILLARGPAVVTTATPQPAAVRQQAERPAETSSAAELAARLQSAAPGERREVLIEYVREQVARVLGAGRLPDRRTGFFELGMDSLMAVELRNRLLADLTSASGVTASTVFDYSTAESLGTHVAATLFPQAAEVQHADPGASDVEQAKALIGLSADDLGTMLDERIEKILNDRA